MGDTCVWCVREQVDACAAVDAADACASSAAGATPCCWTAGAGCDDCSSESSAMAEASCQPTVNCTTPTGGCEEEEEEKEENLVGSIIGVAVGLVLFLCGTMYVVYKARLHARNRREPKETSRRSDVVYPRSRHVTGEVSNRSGRSKRSRRATGTGSGRSLSRQPSRGTGLVREMSIPDMNYPPALPDMPARPAPTRDEVL